MAADELSVRSLMKLGLTEYEARIYVVLARLGPKNASEISFLGKVPRPKTYGAIRGLESKGLLKILPGKPERYIPTSPSEVLIPLVDKLAKEVSESSAVVENLALGFESSQYVYTEKPYERYDAWKIRGREKIYKRLHDMIGESKMNVYLTTTANGLVRAYKAHSESLEKAADRGVKIRMIASVTQGNASVARELSQVIDVRNNPVLLPKFTAVDSAEIFFLEETPDDLNVTGSQDTSTWTNEPLIVKIHERFFDQLWQTLPSLETKRKKLEKPVARAE